MENYDTGAWTPNSIKRAREREVRRDHGTNGTTGPSGHTERGHRATDPGSWDTHPKPGRDHGTTRAHRTGPPGHRFWIRRPMIYANDYSKNPIAASCLGNI